MNLRNTRTNPKPIIFILLLFVLLLGGTKSYSEKVHLQFAPPDATVFYVNSKINQIMTIGERKHKQDLEIQSENHFNKSSTGYIGTSVLINVHMYFDDKRVTLPFIYALTNMTVTFTLDTQGRVIDVKGFDGWDEGVRQSVPEELFDFYRAIIGEETMKKTILKESKEDTDYFILPLGGQIPVYMRDVSSETIKAQHKDCLHQKAIFDTHIKAYSFDPGPAYQAFWRKNNLAPHNIDYSNTEVTGNAERIVDPLTSLEYYEKYDRKIKTIIDTHFMEKIPVTIQEIIEDKFDYPDLITQRIDGSTFVNLFHYN